MPDLRRTDRTIAIMARYPTPGASKTRLIPALGPEGAANVSAEMTAHTIAAACAVPDAGVVVWVDGATPAEMAECFGQEVAYEQQPAGDLGARLLRAFRHAFDGGSPTVLAIGTDCPALDAGTLDAAFEALADADVVLGPAADGGYYLIGVRDSVESSALAQLFSGIWWSTSTVRDQTLLRAKAAELKVAELDVLRDVDVPDDLGTWFGMRPGRDSA